MAQAEKPDAHIPSGLLYDHRLDPESAVRQRLEQRVGPGERVRLVVHMKKGATYVGDLTYFDTESLRMLTSAGVVEVVVNNVAHIIKVPADVV